MTYGDNPVKINERKSDDPLGLNTYTYVPDIYAIRQRGNLYAYCLNNPLLYQDPGGESIILTCIIVGAIIGAVAGGGYAAYKSHQELGYVNGWWVLGGAAGGAALGGLAGWGVGAAATAIGAAMTAGSGGVLGTTIYQTWQQSEQAVRNLIGSVTTYADRVFNTPFGQRVADGFNTTSSVLAEAKYGYVSLSQFVQQQIAKDAYLLQQGTAKAIEWHFYVSQATGQGGPSAPLLQELLKNGFKVIFH